MRRSVVETLMGAAVLAVAAVFVVVAFSSTGISTVDGYKVRATFPNAAGATPGTAVRMGGVKIGSVVQQRLDPDTYFAEVTLRIQDDIKLPKDTSARIMPEGLLGGNLVVLEPGGAPENIQPGGAIKHTQGAINIVDMATRMLFNSGGDGGNSGSDAGGEGDSPFTE